MNFIWIVIILLVIAVAYFKLRETRHHLFYKALAVIVVLFVASVIYVWLKNDINLSTYNGFLSLGRTYYNWLGSFFGNIGKIGGYAVKVFGGNSTASP